MKPKMIGTVNGYVNSLFVFKGIRYTFDGTCKGLAIRLSNLGAKHGDRVRANYGGLSLEGLADYRVYSAPHDNRANGIWVTRESQFYLFDIKADLI